MDKGHRDFGSTPFPDEWIRPLGGRISRAPAGSATCRAGLTSWDIEVDLAPFDISVLLPDSDEETRDRGTSFRFDGVCLPDSSLRPLIGRRFTFPVNPVPGYVDGSIYLMDVHHPADLIELALGESPDPRSVSLGLVVDVRFEYEGSGFLDRRVELRATVELREPHPTG
jgi:hypothetical protein